MSGVARTPERSILLELSTRLPQCKRITYPGRGFYLDLDKVPLGISSGLASDLSNFQHLVE